MPTNVCRVPQFGRETTDAFVSCIHIDRKCSILTFKMLGGGVDPLFNPFDSDFGNETINSG